MSAEALDPVRQAVDYTAIIERIKDILSADGMLNKMVAEWRKGDRPERTMAQMLPCVYVSPADRPQSSVRMIGPASSISALPSQHITTDMLVVVLAKESEPWLSQKAVYSIVNRIQQVLALNVQLRRPTTVFDDPLCQTLEIDSIPRLTTNKGQPIEGMTVMLRLHHHFIRQPAQ